VRHTLGICHSHAKRTDLSPSLQLHATLPPSVAPKRDHDEWLVQRGPGGWWSHHPGPSLSRFALGRTVLSPGRRRLRTNDQLSVGRAERPAWKRPGVTCDPRGSGPAGQLPRLGRDGVGTTVPGSAPAKPKTPAGRRGASLTNTADYPRGAIASPAPLHLSSREMRSLRPPKPMAVGCIGTSSGSNPAHPPAVIRKQGPTTHDACGLSYRGGRRRVGGTCRPCRV